MTSIVGTGNREGKFEWRLQSALGCNELNVEQAEKLTHYLLLWSSLPGTEDAL